MRLLGLLFLIIFATACGGKNSNTNIKVTTSALFGGSAALQNISEGGLMLWGVNDKGNRFGQTLEDADTINLDLPNGTWTFYAVAWDNATNDPLLASTGLKCAESVPTQLAGTQVNVALAVSATTCANDIFRGYASSANSGTINAQLCENLSGVTAYNHVCSDDRITAGANWKSDKVPMMSVKVTLPNYLNNIDVPGGISRCMVMPSNQDGSWTNVTSMKLPIGDVAYPAKSPFRLRLEFFPGNNTCDLTGTARGSITRILPNGLLSPISPIKTFHNSGQHYTFLSISDNEICNGRTAVYTDVAGARNFAGGAGTVGHPYLICSPEQLLSMHDLVNATTYYYRLSANINLNPYSKGVTTATLPSDSDCWEEGQNWMPIGHSYAAPSACTASVTGFTGSFDGNDHSISNLRIKKDNSDEVGFIARLSAPAARVFRDLTFINAEVEGQAKVGALFGSCTATGNQLIENIRITNSRIRARDNAGSSYVGALFGDGTLVDVNKIFISGGSVEGDGSYIGGAFGNLSSSTKLSNVFVNTQVRANNYNSGSTHTGGIGAKFVSTSLAGNIDSLSYEGIITTGSTKVGGLFGELGDTNAGKNLSNFYSKAAITTLNTTSSNMVGGFVGKNLFNKAMINGYFAGHVLDFCSAGCDVGALIGDYSGGTPTGSSDIYYLSDNQPTDAGWGTSAFATSSFSNADNVGLYLTGTLTTFESGPWVHQAGDTPRLTLEQHPCALTINSAGLAGQIIAGRGGASNPLVICKKEQLSTIGALGSGKYVSIVGAVNLTGSFTSPNIPSGVTLSGERGLVFGYTNNLSGTSSGNLAPFATNSGTIKNLDMANIKVSVLAPSSTSSVSGAVYINNGTIDNMSVISGEIKHSASSTAYASGMVYQNNGTIKNSKMSAVVGGINYVAGIAAFNLGHILDSEVEGALFQSTASSSSVFAGIALQNGSSATIKRSVVRSKMNTSYSLDDSSMVVRQNLGLIQDVEISREANWRINSFGATTGLASVAVTNSGTINRVLMNGFLLDTQNATSTIGVNNSGKPVLTNTGTVTGVSWTIPSGRLIQNMVGNGSNYTCSSGVLSVTNYPSSPFNNSAAYWDSTTANNDLSTNNKYVWVVAESNGFVSVARALDSQTSTALKLDVNPSDCSTLATNGMNVYIIQDYSSSDPTAIADYTTSPYNGYIIPGSILGAGSPSFGNGVTLFPVGSPWRTSGVVLDETVTADMDLIIDYYEAILTGQSPASPAIWTIEDGGSKMGLFSINN
ncbi:MAG: hypothetical protein K2P81_08715 [Bacteriovoracaceae bacterium]|nr:hypothetical protein [Bacteriovoracaceae bacterium]